MAPTLFTLGHSNHPFDHFLDLLRAAGVALVADVRSVPHSRRLPHFRRPALEAGLAAAGVGYVWQGEALGGRPRDPALWRAGKPNYAAMAVLPDFGAALDSVLAAARERHVALMCAERDPLECHRFHLSRRRWWRAAPASSICWPAAGMKPTSRPRSGFGGEIARAACSHKSIKRGARYAFLTRNSGRA